MNRAPSIFEWMRFIIGLARARQTELVNMRRAGIPLWNITTDPGTAERAEMQAQGCVGSNPDAPHMVAKCPPAHAGCGKQGWWTSQRTSVPTVRDYP